MMSFLFGYDFGAQAFASGLGIIAPSVPLSFYRHLAGGDRTAALSIVQTEEQRALEALSPVGGWQSLRVGLVYKGYFPSWRERFPLRTLREEEAEVVKGYMQERGFLA
jgi:dihydrodipicolinate synthase/N-acetylneuraminate lyase